MPDDAFQFLFGCVAGLVPSLVIVAVWIADANRRHSRYVADMRSVLDRLNQCNEALRRSNAICERCVQVFERLEASGAEDPLRRLEDERIKREK